MLFELEAVTARRGDRTVLEDLTLGLPAGASAVAGPSGSGKSTLLRLLNRLADPVAGIVRYRGRDVRTLDVLDLRREVCLVPQLPALTEGTVAENLRLAARYGKRDEVPSQSLELAGLDDAYAEREAKRLSVGEQQRVMLARALVLEPRVLLLDEPTSALDPRSRDAIERTLEELRSRLDLSLVLVTHDREQAERVTDTIVELPGNRERAQ